MPRVSLDEHVVDIAPFVWRNIVATDASTPEASPHRFHHEKLVSLTESGDLFRLRLVQGECFLHQNMLAVLESESGIGRMEVVRCGDVDDVDGRIRATSSLYEPYAREISKDLANDSAAARVREPTATTRCPWARRSWVKTRAMPPVARTPQRSFPSDSGCGSRRAFTA